MKWIIVAIAVFIGPYTYLTLHYRKPGPAYAPYADNKDRANTSRLLDAGYQRIALEFQDGTLANGALAPAVDSPAPAGIPVDLADALIDQPLLPAAYADLETPADPQSGAPIAIRFRPEPAPGIRPLQSAHAYRRSELLVIVPELEAQSEKEQSIMSSGTTALTFPPGSLPPGHYRVRLAGAESSREWEMQVH